MDAIELALGGAGFSRGVIDVVSRPLRLVPEGAIVIHLPGAACELPRLASVFRNNIKVRPAIALAGKQNPAGVGRPCGEDRLHPRRVLVFRHHARFAANRVIHQDGSLLQIRMHRRAQQPARIGRPLRRTERVDLLAPGPRLHRHRRAARGRNDVRLHLNRRIARQRTRETARGHQTPRVIGQQQLPPRARPHGIEEPLAVRRPTPSAQRCALALDLGHLPKFSCVQVLHEELPFAREGQLVPVGRKGRIGFSGLGARQPEGRVLA